jgi:hypothetical protein
MIYSFEGITPTIPISMGVYEKQTIKLESNNILLSRNRKVNCEKKPTKPKSKKLIVIASPLSQA